MSTPTNGNGPLAGAVVAVAGAAGPAGRATLLRLAEAGATVVAADADAARLAEAVDAARYAHGGATVTGDTVDLLDLDAARAWADRTEKEFGRVDGLVHLVGGWRGSATFAETDLDDWALLEKLLIRTVQHTSLAFEAPLARSGRGRYLLISAAGASKPTAGNAAYAASKAAAEAWTLALADSFRKAGGDGAPPAAAAILIVKALVHDAMRAERPNAKFAGFTDVKDLAQAIVGVWDKPAQEVNGTRLWLTPQQ
ncbi:MULTISPECIES: SDR family NAD(P)-dependent oxidoreductase [Streptomyces]|uniref:SDR family NAD(P)-dependent oxidoreductase n=1 Tax=Streptomyces morookaense TaxID=1970 RepID=A0A7Y7E8M6_STRMO|nr:MULTISPECIES: SDR family NAD(P)-dependent oxidoreductase [Streptomyces]MCC2276104.1 SDR family NAD(P)-dependent oxidoreductase [Streptomyces sp. ET3-23]NVK79442.1 SDR family NAD(P)-dependent oxidoreductase [Streptomyces morookaense]GHF04101.1 oxidoreductase [Streptomyces morookaense]